MDRPSSGRAVALAPAFTDPASAEAWDAWFRWRDGAHLHDVVVTDTWRRVAGRLVAADTNGIHVEQSLLDAMQRLVVLPDSRVLAQAGTGLETWPADGLAAVVNIAAMVRDPFTAQARLDMADIVRAAGVAVRMLDDAASTARTLRPPLPQLRIGPIGCADAVLMLGLRYEGPQAQRLMQQASAALSLGCIAESVRLAADRGGCGTPAAALRRGQSPDLPPELLRDLERYGVRHTALTALDRHPRLALLANNVADGIDPLHGELQPFAIDAPDGVRVVRSSGGTVALYRRLSAHGMIPARTLQFAKDVPVDACAALRAAMQPHVDAPLERPVPDADGRQHASCREGPGRLQ